MNSFLRSLVFFVGVVATTAKQKSLEELDYRIYPRRTQEEAAVLEWGNSAIISALDASIAKFGPQADQAALLEVECMPVLADPMTGTDKQGEKVEKLDNAEEIHGNMAVMTMNKASQSVISGYQMAKIAKASGAAALLIVNIDQHQLDDIYRLEVDEGESGDDIDFPVVMISYNSANVLTTATVTEGMSEKDIVNHGMPDRIRLYVGGDRPFFEDVDRTMYLIHNLLTDEECDALKEKAGATVKSTTDEVSFLLDRTLHTEKMINMKTGTLHQGMWQSPMGKGIEERLEQVTGFPKEHYTDFVADVFDGAPGTKSYWLPHYSDQSDIGAEVLTTISIYLDDSGPPIVFPSARKQPIKIQPRKGMAVVHHEVDPVGEDVDDEEGPPYNSIHAMMPTEQTTFMVRKYVLAKPLSNARRFVVPLFGMVGGAALLRWLYEKMIAQFGASSGPDYFDKLCIFVPLVIIFAIAQYVVEQMNKGSSKSSDEDKEKKGKAKKKESGRSKRSKKD